MKHNEIKSIPSTNVLAYEKIDNEIIKVCVYIGILIENGENQYLY